MFGRQHRHGHGGVWRASAGARRLGLAQSRYASSVNGNREPDLATFARICRALATTPNEILGFGARGEEGAGAGAERRRSLDAIEAMDRPALRVAAVVLEAMAAGQNELRKGDTCGGGDNLARTAAACPPPALDRRRGADYSHPAAAMWSWACSTGLGEDHLERQGWRLLFQMDGHAHSRLLGAAFRVPLLSRFSPPY